MSRSLLPVKLFLAAVPDSVHSAAFAAVFNHALRGQSVAERFAEIDGKSVMLRIDDVPCELHFRFTPRGLRSNHGHPSDVVIAGNLAEFIQLARRDEDPDTLFFTRRLTIEGETETGLHIKNLLDSLEFDLDQHFDTVLPSPAARAAKALSRLVRQGGHVRERHVVR